MEQQRLFKEENIHVNDEEIKKALIKSNGLSKGIQLNIFNVKLFNNDDRWMPIKAKEGDSCFDLRARVVKNINDKEIDCDKWSCDIMPNEAILVLTGVFIELVPGWEAQIRTRSGLGLKGLIVGNSPGTIDSGYRNEIGVICENISKNIISISQGDRIAQMAIKQVPNVVLKKVDQINETERGMNGFGSTGVK